MSDTIVDLPEFPGYGLSRDGRAWSNKRGGWKVLKPTKEYQGPGYLMVAMRVDGRQKKVFLHTLLLATFVGPRPSPKHQGRHNNGNFLDNDIDNLAWGTAQQNHDDKKRHGTTAAGSRHHAAKLTEDDVILILGYLSMGHTQRLVAEMFGVSPLAINLIKLNKGWKHVERPRAFDLRIRKSEHEAAI